MEVDQAVVGVAVGEQKPQAHLLEPTQAGHEYEDVPFGVLLYTVPARVDVVHHHREGREVERHVVVEHPAGRCGDRMVGAFVNQFSVTDAHPLRRLQGAVAAVKTMVQHPGQIGPMDYAEDERPFRVQQLGKVFRHARAPVRRRAPGRDR